MDDEKEQPETRNETRNILNIMLKLDTVLLTVIWSKILFKCNETSKSLQSDSIPLDVALNLVHSLTDFVKNQRKQFDNYEAAAKNTYPDFEYKSTTSRTRQRSSRLAFFEGAAENTQFQGREKFRIQAYLPIIDELITQLQRRSQAYDELLNFEFYVNDVDGNDLLLECLHFEHYLLQEKMLNEYIPGMYSSSIPIHQMYKLLKNNHLEETFPNLEIAFRIFLSLMITNASGERSFSKLNLIKNELRSSMGQERLRWLSIMSIENDLQQIGFKDTVEEFATRT
ncbi:hypothetical protein RN001_004077 [Aquatica leii]|uniref:HAT C-terminal dimerisation domain-containing protein n=1 Tax=Aquatica leii TaxID=1421715 RepID=A0AAN7SEG7_9COLE|nr:hypothetical protein RN001_004077 [Aquatica leii]